eukprot:GCRY01002016.1.p1 GENE.GCRY01002016.1~~GCRY01002016.1.p1  ORF type:complete len:243 (+),score=14.01 GCRY01002016.1:242-970(+)
MIRNLLLISKSGLVLFSKEITATINQPRLTGSLITAIIDFSLRCVGIPVSYIELENVAVSIVPSEKVICALFHDAEDGESFGKLVAKEILRAFLQDHARTDFTTCVNLKTFQTFNTRIVDAVKQTIPEVLERLTSKRGINYCFLVYRDNIAYSTLNIEQLSVVANLQTLITFTSEIFYQKNQSVNSIELIGQTNRFYLYPLGSGYHLVVACKRAIAQRAYQDHVKDTVFLLEKIDRVLGNLR